MAKILVNLWQLGTWYVDQKEKVVGVINLTIQNQALLIKQLHKFYNRVQVPWVQLIWNTYYHNRIPHATELCGSFWWKDICQLLDKFIAVSKCTFGDGITALFWLDIWRDNQQQLLAHTYDRLFSFAKDSLISVHEVLHTEELLTLFHLPLSVEAFEELQMLRQLVMDVSAEDQSLDVWCWGFGTGGAYSANKYYKQVHDPIISNPLLC